MQDNQDKDTSTDKVQSIREYKKKVPLEYSLSTLVQTGPGAYPSSFTMGTVSLIQWVPFLLYNGTVSLVQWVPFLFPRSKAVRHGINYPLHLALRLKKE
jgi:hypothetical protein